jgi:hypothetical protein
VDNHFDQRGATFTGNAIGSGNTVQNYGVAAPRPDRPAERPLTSDRQVFVVHGRDLQARIAVFGFLRDVGLRPLEWESVVTLTRTAAPHVLEVVRQGFAAAAAVVVILTPDDLASLHPSFWQSHDLWYEREPAGQPRPNVLFEAGMAMALHPRRTVLLQIGWVRPFTDTGGLDFIQIDGSVEKLNNLAGRLREAGCTVDTSGADWLNIDRFSSLEALRRRL